VVLTDFSSMVVGLVVGQEAMGAYAWGWIGHHSDHEE